MLHEDQLYFGESNFGATPLGATPTTNNTENFDAADIVDLDLICDVCLDFNSKKDNEIVVCSVCNVAVHQDCYGSELLSNVPKGNWTCARCREPTNKEIKCSLCSDMKGIIKPVYRKGVRTGCWLHVICVNWLDGIRYKDEKFESIKGSIVNQRTQLPCN